MGGNTKRMEREKALAALSGGVDSSLAAYIGLEMGYDVTGVTLKLFPEKWRRLGKAGCVSEEDLRDAAETARKLHIPYRVEYDGDAFEQEVIAPFAAAYLSGRTPNPCVLCNPRVKFGCLGKIAQAEGFQRMITGHYAMTETDTATGRVFLKRARDREKDQSYVLYALTPVQLRMCCFPLGGMAKSEVRAAAERLGFENAHKKESQDICFIDGDYKDFLQAYTGRKMPEGDFVDAAGNRLGRHHGISDYTVGQRKGLGISHETPLYVIEKNVMANTIRLGQESELYRQRILVEALHWIVPPVNQSSFSSSVKTRYHAKDTACRVFPQGEDRAVVEFSCPVRAPTAGQSAVFYDGDYVLGGGIIAC